MNTINLVNFIDLVTDANRRDLTINSMAMDSDGNIIDYFGGQEDLKNGILRHVSIAFKEDPLRVVRLARFAARYNFKVAPETIEICKEIIQSGELETLDINRLWKEIRRVVHEPFFPRFFQVLRDVGSFDSGRLGQLGSHVASLFYWDSYMASLPTETLIANYFNVSSDLVASTMSISLRKMFDQYFVMTNSFDEFDKEAVVGFILDNRLMQPCEKTDLFFEWLDLNDYVLYGKRCSVATDYMKKIIDIMKTTDVQSVLDSGLKGKQISIAIRNAHIQNVLKGN